MNTGPLVSLVVLGFRNFETVTRSCLESLRPSFADPAIEVLALDNGSQDGSAQQMAHWCVAHPSVRCLLSEDNRGFSGGMNWGASYARGQWLLLVNNDTVFPGGALDALKRVIAETPSDVAMLGPVTNAAGNGQRLWKSGSTHAQWMEIGEWIHAHPSHQSMPTYRCDFFCIAVRRDVWEQLNGLDPSFGLGYYEDFDFSLRLRDAGYQQRITEDMFVLHVGSATFNGSKDARALIKRNKKLLQSKHPDARFEHTRLGNLAVLQSYQQLKSTGQWSSALGIRETLRIGALKEDAPRSRIKRWLWLRKVRQLLG